MLVLFDSDGVIIDSLDQVLTGVEYACSRLRYGKALTRKDIQNVKEIGFDPLANEAGISSDGYARFKGFVRASLKRQLDSIGVFKGMGSVIGRAVASHRLYVLTANDPGFTRRILKIHGLLDYFEDVVSVEGKCSKARMIGELRKDWRVSASSVCFVCDTVDEVHQAREAGVASIAVAWGYHSCRTLCTGRPDFIVRRPRNLARLLNV